MSRMMDADKFLSWLSEVEGEIRKEKMKDCQPDRYDDGLMAATGTVREYVEKMCKIDEAEGKSEKQWISVDERLPEDIDRRYFMCLVENHLEDPPMFCQYEEGYGFGFWRDIYDSVTLGFVDSEFETMEDLKYEKVLYWMPMIELPEEAMQDD